VSLPLDWTFFGLTPKYRVDFQSYIFDLIYHSNGGFSYQDVYHMPVYLRTFYIQKLNKMFGDQKVEHEKQMKTMQSNMPKAPKMRKR
jgi:hypothetical protein